MTAFDNIKTNNWPSTPNEYEDFLVLKAPLKDQASLTESLPVVVGSQELFPKRTLTNTSVAVLEAGDVLYSGGLSSTNGLSNPGKNAFDGSLSTYAQSNLSSDNSINVDFSSNPISYSSSVRIYCYAANGYSITNTYYLNNSGSGTTFTGGAANFNGAAWITVASGSGTLSHLRLRLERGGGNNSAAGLYAIEVDGTILTEPAGGLKKHYDNNAVFTAGGSGTVITYDADTRNALKFGTGDFTVEAWVKKEETSATSGGSACILEIGDHFSNTGVIFWASQSSTKAYSSTGYGSGGALTLGQWHHVAWSRSNGTLKVFRDGQETSSVAFGNDLTDIQYATTGKSTRSTSVSYQFNGVIQDLRVYKGVAKYTSNFTPPSAILS